MLWNRSGSDNRQQKYVETSVANIANGRVVLIHKAEAPNIQGLRISPLSSGSGRKLTSKIRHFFICRMGREGAVT